MNCMTRHRKPKGIVLITIAAVLTSLPVFGQTPRVVLPNLTAVVRRQNIAPAQQSPVIDLVGALSRARTSGQQYLSAVVETAIAAETRRQANAALLPELNLNNEYAFTQSNHEGEPIFVAADGIHVYTSQAAVHSETLSISRRLEYRRALAAEAVARGRQDVALRGLSTSVIANYYALASAQRKAANAQQSLREAQDFADVTQRLETGGEVAHADVVKAQILLEQRKRDAVEAQLTIDKARIALAVFIFPDYNQNFTVVDDLATISPIAQFSEVESAARSSSPELRTVQSVIAQENLGVSVARSAALPSLALDYVYGINANELAANSGDRRNLGYAIQGTLNIPIFSWGAQRSRVREAQLRLEQAQLELALTSKEFSSNLNALYREAEVARIETDSLRTSLDLATESLRLVLLRYQAGEVSVLEVSDAQTTLSEARNAYDEGLVRYKTAWANLQVATGNF